MHFKENKTIITKCPVFAPTQCPMIKLIMKLRADLTG
jgi:hypothetical protein